MEKQTPVLPISNALASSRMQQARAQLNDAFKPVLDILDKYEIPNDKMEAVLDYSLHTLVNNRKMKAARIARKTIEYFKLKKADHEADQVQRT